MYKQQLVTICLYFVDCRVDNVIEMMNALCQSTTRLEFQLENRAIKDAYESTDFTNWCLIQFKNSKF